MKNYFEIQVIGLDDGRAILLGAHELGEKRYLLDTSASAEEVRNDLMQISDDAIVNKLSRAEYESLSRSVLGVVAENPDGH